VSVVAIGSSHLSAAGSGRCSEVMTE
jgi:hypothetical protein